MSFKDYENLDVTKETTSKEEIERLKKKYKIGKEYVVDVRGMLLCLGMALVPTVIVMMLYAYSNIIDSDFGILLTLALPYYFLFLIMTIAIYSIIKKIRIKISIVLLMCSIDVLILITSMIIGIMAPVSIIVKMVFYIIFIITFILFFPLGYAMINEDNK